WQGGRVRALRPNRARTTICPREAKVQHWALRPSAHLPFLAEMALRTARLLVLPVDDKRGIVEALLRLSLPTSLWSPWSHEIDPLLGAADEMDRAHVAGIHQMLAGQAAAVGEMALHHRGRLVVRDGGFGRLPIDN